MSSPQLDCEQTCGEIGLYCLNQLYDWSEELGEEEWDGRGVFVCVRWGWGVGKRGGLGKCLTPEKTKKVATGTFKQVEAGAEVESVTYGSHDGGLGAGYLNGRAHTGLAWV